MAAASCLTGCSVCYWLRPPCAAYTGSLHRVDREGFASCVACRYGSVAPDGSYSSPIPSVSQRFGTMVGGLTTGERALRSS